MVSGTTEYLPQGSEAKHIRLAEALMRDAISKLSPGEPLPSERELMEYYKVSRATVRKSLDGLVSRGTIVRVQGKGTFVATQREDASYMISFTDYAMRSGNRPSSRVIQMGLSVPEEIIANKLGTTPGLPQWRLERIRLINGLPMCHEVSWFPVIRFPDFDDLVHEDSIVNQLVKRYGVKPEHAQQTVWAETADEKLSQLLEIPSDAPVLAVERTIYAQGQVAEVSQRQFRGDRYHLAITTSTTSVANDLDTKERKS